jgi:predicted 3-demethylubiquinone-9 3-methyltransferase (glyoxalase superfamily)
MQKITPCLWFDGRAEEAAEFYTSIFKDSKVGKIARYGEAGPGAPGTVMTVNFQIAGEDFMGLNGGPQFQFSPAVSFVVHCKNQRQVDHYWDRLIEGGAPSQCGWLTDKFGVSWQIVPNALPKMLKAKDPEKARRVMAAMLPMVKLDVKTLKDAYKGKGAGEQGQDGEAGTRSKRGKGAKADKRAKADKA